MARTPEEEQRRRWRRGLLKGLLIGGAAVGLPAAINALVARRARDLPVPRWGPGHRYGWHRGEVAFQELGEGSPVVLLHSFGPGHGAREWSRVAELLARAYRVFVPDYPGWGESDKPDLRYSAELYIEFLSDFLTEVVGEAAVLVGAGISGAYAVALAVESPQRVRALGLVVPVGVDLRGESPELKDALVHRLLRFPILGTSALNLFASRRGLARYLEREVYADPRRVETALVDAYYRYSHLPGAHTSLAAYLAGYLYHPVRSLLPRVTVPVWIAWGRSAVSPSVESADLWLSKLPGADLEVLNGCAVLPHAEAPEPFFRSLDGFLKGLES